MWCRALLGGEYRPAAPQEPPEFAPRRDPHAWVKHLNRMPDDAGMMAPMLPYLESAPAPCLLPRHAQGVHTALRKYSVGAACYSDDDDDMLYEHCMRAIQTLCSQIHGRTFAAARHSGWSAMWRLHAFINRSRGQLSIPQMYLMACIPCMMSVMSPSCLA